MEAIRLDDPLAHSLDLVEQNVARLREVFPQAFTENRIDFDVLRQLLGGHVEESPERYRLEWNGKRLARALALQPSTGTLRPCREESVEWDTTGNLIIEGDNLEVLKILQKGYAGRVKMIYIDPPYNTGKDFVYSDDAWDSLQNYLALTGQSDSEGTALASNVETSGRFHTDWLNMMYPRLEQAWAILAQSGAVFISIDEKELHHLRTICNEVFGEENFVADVTVVTNMKGRNTKKHVADCHEHMVIYAKPEFKSLGLPLTAEQRAVFKHADELGRKYALRDLRKRGGPDKREDRPRMFFPIFWDIERGTCSLERSHDAEVEIKPLRGDGSDGRWRWGKEKIKKHLAWLHPKYSERTGRWDIDHRHYLDPSIEAAEEDDWEDPDFDEDTDDEEDEVFERTSKPKSVWLGGELSTDAGKRALKETLPGEVFDFPKSVDLIRTCLHLCLAGGDVAIDLFAGSGTFGQAVFEQNLSLGGNRRFVLIQFPEQLNINKKEQKAAAKFCAEIGRPANMAEITKERVRRVSAKIRAANPDYSGDVGFRVFKLNSSNIKAWAPGTRVTLETLEDMIDHVKPDRSDEDVLFELILKQRFELTAKVESRTIAGKTVRKVGDGGLVACLDKVIETSEVEALGRGIAEWVREMNPDGGTTCVFRDTAFRNDVAKTNLTETLRQGGVERVRSL
jgi:adenine-specific DNA-methyltransferase